MENITTDIFSFENLRKDGFVYVDKTDMLWRLVSKKDGRQFFIAAIWQIREKGYADQYKGDRRPVTLVGINFRTAKRNIDEPLFVKCERKGEAKPVR